MSSDIPKSPYGRKKVDRIRVDDREGRYYSPDIKVEITGFAPECKGCPHIRVREKKKQCMYVITPKIRKFPCFFKDNVEAGGFDGRYGASIKLGEARGSKKGKNR